MISATDDNTGASAEFTFLRQPLPPRLRVQFLPRAWACVERIASQADEDGLEDGACLAGFYWPRDGVVFVTHLLRGTDLQRSHALLDSRPDTEVMKQQFQEIDQAADGLLFFLGRIHWHGGDFGRPSATDQMAYADLCKGMDAVVCPIVTTRRRLRVHGWVFVAESGTFVPTAVGQVSDQEFMDTFAGEPSMTQAAARKILKVSQQDVAGLLVPSEAVGAAEAVEAKPAQAVTDRQRAEVLAAALPFPEEICASKVEVARSRPVAPPVTELAKSHVKFAHSRLLALAAGLAIAVLALWAWRTAEDVRQVTAQLNRNHRSLQEVASQVAQLTARQTDLVLQQQQLVQALVSVKHELALAHQELATAGADVQKTAKDLNVWVSEWRTAAEWTKGQLSLVLKSCGVVEEQTKALQKKLEGFNSRLQLPALPTDEQRLRRKDE